MTQPGYTSIRLRTEAVDQLRRLTRQLAAQADRDLTTSDALTLALGLADEHMPELVTRAEGSGDGN